MYEDDLYWENVSQGEWIREACFQYAREIGEQNPERQWISTPYDTWERNIFYTGPDQPHPEEY